MRIDFSEPECSTCFHYRTSGILNTQEPEPSNVIASPVVTLTPVSSEHVQDLGHDDSAAIDSTSTSSPVHGNITPSAPAAIASVNSETRGSNNLGFGAFADPRPSTVERPIKALAFGLAPSKQASAFGSSAFGVPQTSIFGRPIHGEGQFRADSATAATSVSSASLGPKTSSFSAFTATGPFPFGPMQAPAATSVSSASLGPKASSFSAFAATRPSPFGPMQAPVQASTSSSFSVGPVQDFGKTASAFGSSAFGAPQQSIFGRPIHGEGQFRVDSAPAATSVSSASLGPTTSSFSAFAVTRPSPFGPMQAPVQASTSSSFSFEPVQDFGKTASAFGSQFGNGVAWARPDVGIMPPSSGPNSSTSTVVFGTTPVSVSSLFGPARFGFTPATTQLPSSSSSSSSPASTFSSNPNIGPQVSASREGSRYTHYTPTRDGVDIYISISASDFYRDKSHEEIRWEDYKQGDKGGSFPAAAHIPPIGGSRPFTASPSIFDSQRTPFGIRPASVFGSFPAAGVTPSSSNGFGQTNAAFTISGFGSFPAGTTTSPSLFASRGVPAHPQWTSFGTTQGNMTSSAFGSFPFGATPSSAAAHISPIGGSRPAPAFGSFPAGATPSSSSGFGQTNASFTGSGFGSFPAGATPSSSSGFGQTNAGFTGSGFGSFPAGATPSSSSGYGQTNAGFTGSGFGSFSAGATPFSSSGFGQTNAAFTGSGFRFHFPAGATPSPSTGFGQTSAGFTVLPSSFAPPYVTVPAAYMSPISRGVPQPFFNQRPHETPAASSPASGCTACGATTNSSASRYFAFNGATIPPSPAHTSGCTACGATTSSSASRHFAFNNSTTPPSAAPTSGCTACGATTSSSAPGCFNFNGAATTPSAAATSLSGSCPMVFGTAFVAYPLQEFILLPFSAMKLQ